MNPIILFQNNGSDNIEGLPHEDLKCPACGQRFNNWLCGKNKIKDVFGPIFFLYDNAQAV